MGAYNYILCSYQLSPSINLKALHLQQDTSHHESHCAYRSTYLEASRAPTTYLYSSFLIMRNIIHSAIDMPRSDDWCKINPTLILPAFFLGVMGANLNRWTPSMRNLTANNVHTACKLPLTTLENCFFHKSF